MAKILVLRSMGNEKIAEIAVSDKPTERSVVVVSNIAYRIFKLVSPNLRRGDDIVYRATAVPV